MLTECCYFFFNDTATTEIYTLSLHDALPICRPLARAPGPVHVDGEGLEVAQVVGDAVGEDAAGPLVELAGEGELRRRSEEHTSELQLRQYLVCRLLLEKKKN